MDELNYIAVEDKKRSICLQVLMMKQREHFVAFSPVLDLCAHGDTFEEAQQAFDEVVRIFIDDLVENDTLEEVLSSQGWDKIEDNWVPPTIVSQESQTVQISLCA